MIQGLELIRQQFGKPLNKGLEIIFYKEYDTMVDSLVRTGLYEPILQPENNV